MQVATDLSTKVRLVAPESLAKKVHAWPVGAFAAQVPAQFGAQAVNFCTIYLWPAVTGMDLSSIDSAPWSWNDFVLSVCCCSLQIRPTSHISEG